MLPVAILMGGRAVRLGAIAEKTPKSLVEINGKPFLAHQLELLHSRGIRRAVLCVGHLGDMIRDFAGSGTAFGIELEYSFDGPEALGTGGALRRALPLVGSSFFVLYGDSYLACDYARVQLAFERSGKQGLMTVYRNRDAWDASNVEFAGGRIVAYDKRERTPGMQHIDYGLGVFHAEAFGDVACDRPTDLAEIYQHLLRQDQLAACEVEERFYEIGSVGGIEDLSRALRTGV